MMWPLFSLVLASATGWSVLAIGYLPVPELRANRREPWLAALSWGLVAATAPRPIFHWYLIFAVLGLVAWTRLDRPAGKVWLALAGSLGISLGIVFPLEVAPDLMLAENPLALAALFLGGAVTGIAYALGVAARRPEVLRWPTGFARALVVGTVTWTALLAGGLRWIDRYSRSLTLPGQDAPFSAWSTNVSTPLAPAIVLIVLATAAWIAARRGALTWTRWIAAVSCALAFATSLLVQLIYR